MKLSILSAVAATQAISTVSACDLPGCDHPDLGSCGNACCSLTITVNESSEVVMNKVNATISSGGPDGLYTAQITADGSLGFSDLRSYPIDFDFVGQAWHKTLNGVYDDTVNFNLKSVSDGEKTEIRAHSISQIAGALGDAGQNHWNIMQLVNGIEWADPDSVVVEHNDASCPEPTK